MSMLLAALPAIIATTVRMATPLLFVTLGELFSERAGQVNIGLDGLMAIGALVGFLVGYTTGNPWLGVLAAAVSGVAVNLIYAFCTITLMGNQIVYGMAVNILAPALATFIYKVAVANSTELLQGVTMAPVAIPLLCEIPVIGDAFFRQSLLGYAAFLLVPLAWWFFARFHAGLDYRAVGENPRAAESLGVDVIRTKYLACIICGALAGIGGSFLTLVYTSTYAEGIVAGRGFIALSAVIFGRWSPVGVLGACMLFGFCDALQITLQVQASGVPYQFFQMIPYVVTLVALLWFGSKQPGPKANGQPYFREQR